MIKNVTFATYYYRQFNMKRIVKSFFVFPITVLLAVLAISCTKQCDCYKITHYSNYSTDQYYTETVDGESSCSSLNGEYFHEDAFGNPISVDVVTCREAM